MVFDIIRSYYKIKKNLINVYDFWGQKEEEEKSSEKVWTNYLKLTRQNEMKRNEFHLSLWAEYFVFSLSTFYPVENKQRSLNDSSSCFARHNYIIIFCLNYSEVHRL